MDFPTAHRGARAAILSAASDPLVAMRYLQELDDPTVSFVDLATHLDAAMNKTDVKLFAAIVNACKSSC